MTLQEMAKYLALPEDSSVEEVLTALQKRDVEHRTQLEAMTAEIAKRGVQLGFPVKEGDTAETIALKKALDDAEGQLAVEARAAATAVLDRMNGKQLDQGSAPEVLALEVLKRVQGR